jgi:hypothetical protein
MARRQNNKLGAQIAGQLSLRTNLRARPARTVETRVDRNQAVVPKVRSVQGYGAREHALCSEKQMLSPVKDELLDPGMGEEVAS